MPLLRDAWQSYFQNMKLLYEYSVPTSSDPNLLITARKALSSCPLKLNSHKLMKKYVSASKPVQAGKHKKNNGKHLLFTDH